MSGFVEVKVTQPVGTIVINRPEAGNVISRAMLEELQQAIGDLYQEKRVRAAILTGAGDVFSMGQDLAELAADHAESGRSDAERHEQFGDDADAIADVVSELLRFPKPVIAAVNGPVAGLGVALVMAADVVLACDTAELSVPDARHGLVAGLVAPLVAYRVGAAAAARLAVAGQSFDAAEAHRLDHRGIIGGDDQFYLLAKRLFEMRFERLRLLDQGCGIFVGQQRDTQLGGVLGLGESGSGDEREGGGGSMQKEAAVDHA